MTRLEFRSTAPRLLDGFTKPTDAMEVGGGGNEIGITPRAGSNSWRAVLRSSAWLCRYARADTRDVPREPAQLWHAENIEVATQCWIRLTQSGSFPRSANEPPKEKCRRCCEQGRDLFHAHRISTDGMRKIHTRYSGPKNFAVHNKNFRVVSKTWEPGFHNTFMSTSRISAPPRCCVRGCRIKGVGDFGLFEIYVSCYELPTF